MYICFLFFLNFFIRTLKCKDEEIYYGNDTDIIQNRYVIIYTPFYLDKAYVDGVNMIYGNLSKQYFSKLFKNFSNIQAFETLKIKSSKSTELIKNVANFDGYVRNIVSKINMTINNDIKTRLEEKAALYFYKNEMQKKSFFTKITSNSDPNDIFLNGDTNSMQLAVKYTDYRLDYNKKNTSELPNNFEYVIDRFIDFIKKHFYDCANRNTLIEHISLLSESFRSYNEELYYTSLFFSNIISHIKTICSGIINLQGNDKYLKNMSITELNNFCSNCNYCLEELVSYALEIKKAYRECLKSSKNKELVLLLQFSDLLEEIEAKYDLIVFITKRNKIDKLTRQEMECLKHIQKNIKKFRNF